MKIKASILEDKPPDLTKETFISAESDKERVWTKIDLLIIAVTNLILITQIGLIATIKFYWILLKFFWVLLKLYLKTIIFIMKLMF